MTTQPLGPNQEAWVRDLETTDAPQTQGALHRLISAFGSPVGYCCLGRACVVLKINETPSGYDHFTLFGEDDRFAVLPKKAMELLALRSNIGERADGRGLLAEDNDSGLTFKQIAAKIRAEPEQYFTEPR